MRQIYFLLLFILVAACSSKADENAKKLNDKGVIFLDQEEFTKAANAFHTALNSGEISDDLEAGILRNLSLLHSFQEKKDSALFYAKKAKGKTEKGSYYYYLTNAEYDLLQENIKESINNFEKAKAIKPEEMAIYNSLGMIYSGKYGSGYEDMDKALINNKKAYELAPREPLADALATSYMNLERYRESIPLWKGLIDKNPSKMEYHFQLGTALYFSGQEAEGEEKMEYAAERDANCRRMLDEMIAE
jgi:tetratricopeptide (TPR) repeat protein